MSFLQIQAGKSAAGEKFSYVHLATSVWQKDKGRPVQKRIYLGKLDAAGENVEISKSFPGWRGTKLPLAELRRRVESKEDLVVWLHKSGPVQLPSAGNSGVSEDPPASVEIVGDAHLLLYLAQETKVGDFLSEAFGERDGTPLLGLAMQQVANGQALYLAGDWLDERQLPACMTGDAVSADAAYGLMMRIGEDIGRREEFFRSWTANLGNPQALICDTTSISSHATDLELVEWGYNRDGEDLPQINLTMAATRADGTPVWFRLLPGSIPDVSSLCKSSEFLLDLGLSDFDYSLDRGFYSQANVRDLLSNGLGFVIGVPLSLKAARQLIRKHRASLLTPKRSFPFHGRIMRHVCGAWTIEMSKGKKRPVDAHLFFDPARQVDRMNKLENDIFALEAKASKEKFESFRQAREWLTENARGLSFCFSIRKEEDTLKIHHKPRSVSLLSANMGFTLVLASKKGRKGADILEDYRSRDQVEKIFDMLKNEDHQKRFRSGNNHSVEGRAFLAFISLILRAALEKKMRDGEIIHKVTIPELLTQLRKIKAVRTAKGKRILLEISKRNRTLLEALKIPLPN
jgi:DNA-binding GntR family transcriptional regulator